MGLAKKNSFRKFSADSVQDRILFGHSRMFSMCSLVCLLLWELLVVHGDGNIDPRRGYRLVLIWQEIMIQVRILDFAVRNLTLYDEQSQHARGLHCYRSRKPK